MPSGTLSSALSACGTSMLSCLRPQQDPLTKSVEDSFTGFLSEKEFDKGFVKLLLDSDELIQHYISWNGQKALVNEKGINIRTRRQCDFPPTEDELNKMLKIPDYLESLNKVANEISEKLTDQDQGYYYLSGLNELTLQKLGDTILVFFDGIKVCSILDNTLSYHTTIHFESLKSTVDNFQKIQESTVEQMSEEQKKTLDLYEKLKGALQKICPMNCLYTECPSITIEGKSYDFKNSDALGSYFLLVGNSVYPVAFAKKNSELHQDEIIKITEGLNAMYEVIYKIPTTGNQTADTTLFLEEVEGEGLHIMPDWATMKPYHLIDNDKKIAHITLLQKVDCDTEPEKLPKFFRCYMFKKDEAQPLQKLTSEDLEYFIETKKVLDNPIKTSHPFRDKLHIGLPDLQEGIKHSEDLRLAQGDLLVVPPYDATNVVTSAPQGERTRLAQGDLLVVPPYDDTNVVTSAPQVLRQSSDPKSVQGGLT